MDVLSIIYPVGLSQEEETWTDKSYLLEDPVILLMLFVKCGFTT